MDITTDKRTEFEAYSALKGSVPDFFEPERSLFSWQIAWIRNELQAAHEWPSTPIERAQKIWNIGCELHAWDHEEYSFNLYWNLLNYVGLSIKETE